MSLRMLRKITFARYATTHPTNAMITTTMIRGRMCAKPRASSCIACVNSLTIIFHIVTSLSTVPYLQQIWLHSFEFQTQRLNIVLHVGGSTVAVLQQEGKRSAAKKRRQRLDDVIPADHRLVIGRGKFVNRLHPQLSRITEAGFFQTSNSLQLRQRRRGKN